MVAYVMEYHQISISRACRVAPLPKSMYYYKSRKDDSETITKLQELAGSYPTEGQDLYYGRIRTELYKWNYKRVRRVYLLLGLNQKSAEAFTGACKKSTVASVSSAGDVVCRFYE